MSVLIVYSAILCHCHALPSKDVDICKLISVIISNLLVTNQEAYILQRKIDWQE